MGDEILDARFPDAEQAELADTFRGYGADPDAAAVALLAGGMVVGRLTGRSMVRSGLRQLALGVLAVAVTFAVGSLIGGRVG